MLLRDINHLDPSLRDGHSHRLGRRAGPQLPPGPGQVMRDRYRSNPQALARLRFRQAIRRPDQHLSLADA